ncbi:MAG: lauroyl acyltransferase [Rikenellaceae bacterium]|nr:lauroyl acyltransferase [Rikenellaceae bacterium]
MAKDNNRYTMTRWQRVKSAVLYGLCRFIAIMPRFVRYYILQEILYFILQYIIRYRRRVVMENLRNAFPEKSEKELRGIAKRFNLNLAEQIINTISIAGISTKRLKSYLRFPDAERYAKATADTDIVLFAAHHGSWEYLTAVGCYDKGHRLISVYHPLSDNALDDLFKRLRHCENMELVPRDESILYFVRHRGRGPKMTFGLIADQNPFWYHDAHWITFFHQETIFAKGGEQIAMKYSLPVWFCYMRRLRRGEYELCVEQLYDGKEVVEENVITERYAHRLEEVIRECPELWLWSHRRWKHKKTW